MTSSYPNLETHLALDLVHFDPENSRKHIDEDEVSRTAKTIDLHGILQPVVVAPHPDLPSAFLVVFGEMRIRAARRSGRKFLVNAKGKIPEFVRVYLTEEEIRDYRVIENVRRSPLLALEQSQAYSTTTAARIGESDRDYRRQRNLVSLITPFRNDLLANKLPRSHAEELASVPADAQQRIRERLYSRCDGSIPSLDALKADIDTEIKKRPLKGANGFRWPLWMV